MSEFLVMRLTAALSAMGDVAGHSRRGSHRWPGKSAVLGMVGAALGIDRNDTAGQSSLATDYGVAVLVRSAGTLLIDFHTSQTIPSAAARNPMSRKEALERATASGKLNTTITYREYRQDVTVDIAIDAKENAHWSLSAIADSLRKPHYVLYFGRKACPLTDPLAPRIVSGTDPISAMRSYNADPATPSLPHQRHAEQFAVCEAGSLAKLPNGATRQTRWDAPGDRQRWQFANRAVVVVPLHVRDCA